MGTLSTKRLPATYVQRVKPYEYLLLCGLTFRSHTPSVADRDGAHYFPCRRCKLWHMYTVDQLPTLQRTASSARDMAHVERLDKALVKDRIVQALRVNWSTDSYEKIAQRYQVSLRTVKRVAAELGVYDYGPGDASVGEST